MPIRIQRKRVKGWKMPENCVYIGRPTKWGNPFQIGKDGTRNEVIVKYYGYIKEKILLGLITFQELEELRGKDLACWCNENESCHADILMNLANQKQINQ